VRKVLTVKKAISIYCDCFRVC